MRNETNSIIKRGLRVAGPHSLNDIVNRRFTMAGFLKMEIVAVMVLTYLLNNGVSVGMATYAIDMLNLVLLIVNIRYIEQRSSNTAVFDAPVVIFFVFCLFTSVVNLVTAQWVFWEALSFGRLFIWIYLFRIFWAPEDAESIVEFLYKLQVVNAAFVVYQYAVLGLFQDNIGGMFGIMAGCNAPLNVYLCFVCAWGISGYLCNTVKSSSLVLTVLVSLIIAAVAELKIFYLEFVFLFFFTFVYVRFSKKAFFTALLVVAIAAIGLYAFSIINPENFEILIDVDSLLEYSDLQSAGYGVSRSHPFSQLTEQFFGSDTAKCLYGMGFGSASQSSIPFFTSDFYYLYGGINYHYLITAMLFLQVGYVGFGLYVIPFILLVLALIIKRKSLSLAGQGRLGCFAFVMVVIFLINVFYNNTAHSYLSVFWSLAISIGLFSLGSSKDVPSQRMVA